MQNALPNRDFFSPFESMLCQTTLIENLNFQVVYYSINIINGKQNSSIGSTGKGFSGTLFTTNCSNVGTTLSNIGVIFYIVLITLPRVTSTRNFEHFEISRAMHCTRDR